MRDLPKYAKLEIERRWLVDLSRCPPLDANAAARITDRYISHSQLRLRKIECASGEVLCKLCKKYDRVGPFAQPIVNIYLSVGEYELLNQLPGHVVTKQRHKIADGAVDIYPSREGHLGIFEVEFDDISAAAAYTPPEFAFEEVTHDNRYSGATLAVSE
jgi:CYTH domain-containing protein